MSNLEDGVRFGRVGDRVLPSAEQWPALYRLLSWLVNDAFVGVGTGELGGEPAELERELRARLTRAEDEIRRAEGTIELRSEALLIVMSAWSLLHSFSEQANREVNPGLKVEHCVAELSDDGELTLRTPWCFLTEALAHGSQLETVPLYRRRLVCRITMPENSSETLMLCEIDRGRVRGHRDHTPHVGRRGLN